VLIYLEKEHGKKLKKLAAERPRGAHIYLHHGMDITVRVTLPIPDNARVKDLLTRHFDPAGLLVGSPLQALPSLLADIESLPARDRSLVRVNEAGLTDEAEIHAAIHESRRMSERLRAHPLFTELDSAERFHEVSYYSPEGRGYIDLLYRADTGWTIIDFKTDEIRSEEEARETIRREQYDVQVARYAQAIATQLKVKAKTRLVFLNVKDDISIFDL